MPTTIRTWSAQEIPTGRSARPITRWILCTGNREFSLPVAESLEPAATGGLHRVVRLTLRNAGWWWPERFANKPVLISVAQVTAESRSWAVYPDLPSPDPERHAHTTGEDEELNAGLACEPHALICDASSPTIAVDSYLGVL